MDDRFDRSDFDERKKDENCGDPVKDSLQEDSDTRESRPAEDVRQDTGQADEDTRESRPAKDVRQDTGQADEDTRENRPAEDVRQDTGSGDATTDAGSVPYEERARRTASGRQETEPDDLSSEPYHSAYDAYRFRTPSDVRVTLDAKPEKKRTWLKVLVGILIAAAVVLFAGAFGYKVMTGRSLVSDLRKDFSSRPGSHEPGKEIVLGAPKSGKQDSEGSEKKPDGEAEADGSTAEKPDGKAEANGPAAEKPDGTETEKPDGEAEANGPAAEKPDGAETEKPEGESGSTGTDGDLRTDESGSSPADGGGAQRFDERDGAEKVTGAGTSGQKGSGAYLGITCMTMPEAYTMSGYPSGVYVMDVNEEGPADRGGIVEGDILTWFDGKDLFTKEDLIEALTHYMAGDAVEIGLSRFVEDAGSFDELTVTVTLADRKSMAEGESDNTESLGMSSEPKEEEKADGEPEEEKASSEPAEEEKVSSEPEEKEKTGAVPAEEEKVTGTGGGTQESGKNEEDTKTGDKEERAGIPGGNYRKG